MKYMKLSAESRAQIGELELADLLVRAAMVTAAAEQNGFPSVATGAYHWHSIEIWFEEHGVTDPDVKLAMLDSIIAEAEAEANVE